MRARIAAVVGALAMSLALAAACNPLFGIVERTAGPTWCEEPAQAGSAYCDDFDRVPASTTAEEEPQTVNGTSRVTSAVSSSPPNSLELTSPAVSADTPQVLVSTLVNFGSSYSATASPFRCRIDVQPAEISAIGEAAGQSSVAVIGLGGEVQGTPLTEFVFVTIGHGGVISAQLGSVGADDGVTMIGPACPVLNAGGADDAWATLQISMAPIPPSDGGSHAPGSADAGEPCAIGAKGRPTYVAVIQYGPFENAVLVPATFAGLPLLGYGIVATGPAPAVTLHIDNAACSVLLDGGVAPP